MNLTPEKILSYAPDPGTAQRSKTVAHRQRWLTLEGNGRAIWGTLGNPTDPFRTQVDFTGPAFQCSCPVRRQPCKHGIGLLLLFSKNNDVFRVITDPPEWVNSWLQTRDARRSKTTPQRSAEAEKDLAEKRKQNRERRRFQMAVGIAELESWLTDLVRQGLASLEGQADSYWSNLAAHMVDAKLGGLARRIRSFPLLMMQEDWHEKLLLEIGDIYLIVKGFQNMQQLPEPLQDDIMSILGVNFKKDDVLAGEGLEDFWLVAGQTEAEEENLMARRTWLVGEKSKKNILLLDFSWGGNPYEISWKLGTVINGEVAFYPSAHPQRVLFKKFEYVDKPFDLASGFATLEVFAKSYAEAIGALPWLGYFPAFLTGVIPIFIQAEFSHQNDTFVIVDSEHKQLPLLADDGLGWKMIALSGGKPISIFGVWDGKFYQPLSVVIEGRFRAL